MKPQNLQVRQWLSFFLIGVYSVSCAGDPSVFAGSSTLQDPLQTVQAEKSASGSSSVMASSGTSQNTQSLGPSSPLSLSSANGGKTSQRIGNELFEITTVAGKRTNYKKTTYRMSGNYEVVSQVYEIVYNETGGKAKEFYTYYDTLETNAKKSVRTRVWSGTYGSDGLLQQTYDVSFDGRTQKRTKELYTYYTKNTATNKSEVSGTWYAEYAPDGKTITRVVDKRNTGTSNPPATPNTPTTPQPPSPKPAPDLVNAVKVGTYNVSSLLKSDNSGYSGGNLVLDVLKESNGRTHIVMHGSAGVPDSGGYVFLGRGNIYSAFDVTDIRIETNSKISFTSSAGDIVEIEIARTVNPSTDFVANLSILSRGTDTVLGAFQTKDKVGLDITGAAYLKTREIYLLNSKFSGSQNMPHSVTNYEWEIKNSAAALLSMRNLTRFVDAGGAVTEVHTEQDEYLRQSFGRYTLSTKSVPDPFDATALATIVVKAFDASGALVTLTKMPADIESYLTFRAGVIIGAEFVKSLTNSRSNGTIVEMAAVSFDISRVRFNVMTQIIETPVLPPDQRPRRQDYPPGGERPRGAEPRPRPNYGCWTIVFHARTYTFYHHVCHIVAP